MTRPVRVLLVDDTPESVEPLQIRFRALGWQTTIVTDGSVAVQQVADDPPAVVVMDVMMPELNGYQACRALRRQHPLLPILILTGKSSAADRYWAMECGATDFLTKPADPAAVAERIASILGLP